MKKLLAVIAALLVSVNSFADVASEIQRNIDTQYKDKLRQIETGNRLNFIKEQIPKAPQPQVLRQNPDAKKYIKKVVVKYVPSSGIFASSLNKITKPYENRPLSMKEIGDMQQKIQQYFFNAGYSSVRIYIDAASMSDDILTFKIADGYIEDVVFKRKSGRKIGKFAQRLQRFSFYPLVRGELLNIKDLDQGLEQVNRLATSSSQMEILPGSKPSSSVVEITNNSKKRFIVSLGADDGGSKNTGIYKTNASVSSDNLLMLNDNIYFNYSRNIDGNLDNKENNSYFASISVPFGYFTFTFSSFNSDYSAPGTSYGSYVSDGSTDNKNAGIEMVIKRAQNYKFSTGAEMALKVNANYINGEKLETSSKKLTVASGFLSASYYMQSSMLYGKLSYSKGLDCFDSARNSAVEGAPAAQFDLYSLYLQYSRSFALPLVKIYSSYAASLNAQLTPDVLYGSEQITLGGKTSVRGFKDGSVSGDNGGYIRNDLNFSLANIFGRKGFFDILADANLNLFIDCGYARHEGFGRDYRLAGSGAGISYKAKYFNASCVWARSIYNVSDIEDEGDVFYFNLEAKYYF
jgi:hemolysin activation/secretion protein